MRAKAAEAYRHWRQDRRETLIMGADPYFLSKDVERDRQPAREALCARRIPDVLRRINDHPAFRLHELLPWNWQEPTAEN